MQAKRVTTNIWNKLSSLQNDTRIAQRRVMLSGLPFFMAKPAQYHGFHQANGVRGSFIGRSTLRISIWSCSVQAVEWLFDASIEKWHPQATLPECKTEEPCRSNIELHHLCCNVALCQVSAFVTTWGHTMGIADSMSCCHGVPLLGLPVRLINSPLTHKRCAKPVQYS